MGLSETLEETDTAVLIVAGLAVGLVVLVALTVVLAAIVGTFVLGVGDDVESNVQAGAAITGGADENQVTVTWTSNQNGDALVVEWTASDVAVVESPDGVQADGGRIELAEVGQAVTLSDDDPETSTDVTITVTGVGAADETVILTKDMAV